MLDNLIMNQTPHIHIYNEIEPSKEQPIALYDQLANSTHVIHSIKPKLSQKKIHNALPLLNYLNEDVNVKGAVPPLTVKLIAPLE